MLLAKHMMKNFDTISFLIFDLQIGSSHQSLDWCCQIYPKSYIVGCFGIPRNCSSVEMKFAAIDLR